LNPINKSIDQSYFNVAYTTNSYL